MVSREFLISEFSNPKRVEILHYLSETPLTFTELSNRLQISSSEVSRHLSRLMDQGFIQKPQSSRNFELAPLGKLILVLFAPLDFVFTYAEYFQTHQLLDLPPELLRDLNALKDCEFVSGTGLVMSKIAEIANNAEREMWVMTKQPFPFGKSGLDVKYIVPPEMLKYREEVETQNKSTDARVIRKISISMIQSDAGGWMLFFPDLKGQSDFSAGFYADINNVEGQAYMYRIWEHFWTLGEVP